MIEWIKLTFFNVKYLTRRIIRWLIRCGFTSRRCRAEMISFARQLRLNEVKRGSDQVAVPHLQRNSERPSPRGFKLNRGRTHQIELKKYLHTALIINIVLFFKVKTSNATVVQRLRIINFIQFFIKLCTKGFFLGDRLWF